MAGDKTVAEGKVLEEQEDGSYAERFVSPDLRALAQLVAEQTQVLRQIRFGIGLLVDEDLSEINEQ